MSVSFSPARGTSRRGSPGLRSAYRSGVASALPGRLLGAERAILRERRVQSPPRGETDAGETSAHRIEGEADPLLVVTDGGEAQPSEPDRGPWVSLRRVAAQSAWRAGPGRRRTSTPGRPTPGRRRPIPSRARPTRCSSSPTGERLSHRSQIAARGSAYVVSRPRVPGAPRVRARPELPLRATIPEGNTVGQHADVDVD